MYNSIGCSTFIVKCPWDGLLEGRNCSCAWLFLCSDLCNVNQMATVQRGSVLDVRGPAWFCQPFCSLWTSIVLGERGGLYQWFTQQSGVPSVFFWGQIWQLNWTRKLLTCRAHIQWWRGRTLSAAPVASWTSSAGEGSTTSAGPFSQWTECDCPISGPEKCWCPGTWMTPLSLHCCPWWWVGGVQGGFSWSPQSSPHFWPC